MSSKHSWYVWLEQSYNGAKPICYTYRISDKHPQMLTTIGCHTFDEAKTIVDVIIYLIVEKLSDNFEYKGPPLKTNYN